MKPIPSIIQAICGITLGVFLIALSARVEVPMIPVPMTLQTYAVLTLSALYGWKLGTITLLTYTALAGFGYPVLSGAKSGWEAISGPTGGYLLGFIVAAMGIGFLRERAIRSWAMSVLMMILAHGAILALGFAYLTKFLPLHEAFEKGVQPFLFGALWKSVAAAISVRWILGASRRFLSPDSYRILRDD